MTHLHMLASSARPLAEVLVDALRRHTNPIAQLRHTIGENDDDNTGDDQLGLRLDDEADDAHQNDAIDMLRPDEVAVAVLLGLAFDGRRDVLARLQDSDTITVIEVPGLEYVNVINHILRRHILGPTANILDGDSLEVSSTRVAAAGTVAVFVRRDDPKSKGSSGATASGTAEFAAAVQRRCAVVAIAAEPERQLPGDLVRLADHRIVVPPLNAKAVAAVIAAITGRYPDPIDEEISKRATLKSLMVAVRADLGAFRCVERLSKLVARSTAAADTTPTLHDLHGLGEAREFGLRLVDDLRDYKAGLIPWAAVAKSVLIWGPPGTGKTLFARALAKTANVNFIATSYAEWQGSQDGHLGAVTKAIQNCFANAKKSAPCILFIDEIDTLPRRGTGRYADDWWTAIVNAVLQELDGFERREGVVVVTACNSDPQNLDPALVRSGRLDKSVYIQLPDMAALVGIFRAHLGADLAGIDVRAAALAARGHTGADVERWVREARRVARIAGRVLELKDLLDAVRGGEPEWPADVRHRVSYHEAGHAIVLLALGLAEPKSLSIGAGGGLAESDLGEVRAQTRPHMEQVLVAFLAGRAAEQLIFGEATAGAGGGEDSDLARATQLATRLETAYGLGSLGLVCIPGETGDRDLLLFGDLRSVVGRTIDRAYTAALELLGQNRRALDALAAALFAAGYLDRAEIAAVLKKTPLHTEPTEAPAVRDSQQQPHTGHGDTAVAGAEAPPFYPALINET